MKLFSRNKKKNVVETGWNKVVMVGVKDNKVYTYKTHLCSSCGYESLIATNFCPDCGTYHNKTVKGNVK